MREDRGACKVKSFVRWANEASFTLACERGGDVTLELSLDEEERGRGRALPDQERRSGRLPRLVVRGVGLRVGVGDGDGDAKGNIHGKGNGDVTLARCCCRRR